MAAERGLDIIAFRLDDVQPPPNIEVFLRSKQWIDAFGGQFDYAANALAETITSSHWFPARLTRPLLGHRPVNHQIRYHDQPNAKIKLGKVLFIALLLFVLLGGGLYYRFSVIPKQEQRRTYEEGISAAAKGDYDLAISDFTRVLAISPTNVQALLRRAQTYLKLGKDGLARSDVDRAIGLGSAGDPSLHLLTAEILEPLHEYDKAIEQYDFYLASESRDPGQVETVQRLRSDLLNKAEASRVAENWLAQLDSQSPPANWVTILPKRKKELGTVNRRKLKDCEKRADNTLKCTFSSVFDNAPSALEIVVLKKVNSRNWEVDGYGYK